MSRPVAVVTGAGRGIGRSIALSLAGRGCDLALLGRTVLDLEATLAEVVEHGGRALALRCDVGSPVEVDHAKASVLAELGVPRVVVNNAGAVRRGLVHETSVEDWDEVLDATLKGTFLVTRAFLPSMLQQRCGRVLTISSISGTLGTPLLSAYCAAKWGVLGFMKSLAEELRGTGLQAISVLPGSVDTRMLEGSGFSPAMRPEDVAGVVTYAALDAPDAMNGSAVEMFGPLIEHDSNKPSERSVANSDDAEDLVAEVPVFPLGQVVLFPRALLPLHVFEPRYRAMLEACLSGSRRLVVALVPDAQDLDEHGNPRIARIAGVGNIVEHETLPDGRSNILLQGVARVRLEELPFVGPYRRARTTCLTEEADAQLSAVDLTALVAAVTAFSAEVCRRDPTFEFRLPAQVAPAVLADLAAQHLIADATVRQSALEELDLTRRAELVMRELAVQQRALMGESRGALH